MTILKRETLGPYTVTTAREGRQFVTTITKGGRNVGTYRFSRIVDVNRMHAFAREVIIDREKQEAEK